MNKKEKGFTLIEVVISLAIISLALVSFVSLFSQSLILTDRGSEITQEIFDHQEIIENEIVRVKKGFVDGSISADDTISIFYDDYQSEVDVKIITEEINGNRKFETLVSNVEVLTPALPDVVFNIGVYPSINSSTEVFPWYDDNVVIRVDYTLKNDPVIFNNRIRWFQSKEDVINPSFQSEYDKIYEVEENEPFLLIPEESLLTTDNSEAYYSIPSRFYNFELRAYTLAGRLGYYMNDDRILILPRNGSQQWQGFIEDVYSKTPIDDTIIFENLNEDVIVEVMQNPNRPTLNTDWFDNIDSEGAQVAMAVPTDNYRTDVKFKVDSRALSNNISPHGFGFLLGDSTNSGLSLNFDVTSNTIDLREVINGSYSGNVLSTINLLTHDAFQNFRSTIDGEVTFKWNQEFNLTVSYLYDDLILQMEYINDEGDLIKSNSIVIDTGAGYNYDYFGFKSYSGLDYIFNERYEIVNKYERNYSAHFFDILIPLDINATSDNDWTNGGSHIIVTNNPEFNGVAYNDDLIIKAYRFNSGNDQDLKLSSSKSIEFYAQIFFIEGNLLEIKSRSELTLNANQIVFDLSIELEDPDSTLIMNVLDQETIIADDNKIINIPEEFRDVLVNGDTIGGLSGVFYGEVYFSNNVYKGDELIIESGYYKFPDGFNIRQDYDLTPSNGGLIPQNGGLIPVY